MEKMTQKVEFKVSMCEEDRKAGKTKKVEFDVDFTGVSQDTLRTLAISCQVIRWQAQIKSHWTEFLEGKLPKVVQFGAPLFSGMKGAPAPMTTEKATEFLKGQSRLEQVRAIISMMETNKMDVPQGLYDEEELLVMEAAEAKIAAGMQQS